MCQIFRAVNPKGFTLVELLIVVAIIGVLATVGVPTWRTMVQKARQSEAKTHLGAVFVAERAFHSEHGFYGNHLLRMGIDFGPTRQQGVNYWTGFSNATCGCTQILPDVLSATGMALQLEYPQYYIVDPLQADCSFGRGPFDDCMVSDVAATLDSFVAISQGVIRIIDAPDSTPISERDIWSINEQRSLTWVQSGIR